MALKSFISTAKRVTDVRTFLKDSAKGNSIKYTSEQNKRDVLYVPMIKQQVTDENGNTVEVNSIISIEADIHEWRDSSNNSFHGCVCMKNVVRTDDDGNTINDGTCPFCDRVNDSWAIYNYRKNIEEANCKLTGDDRDKFLKEKGSSFRDEMKIKAAKPYMYILVAKFRTEGNQFVLDDSGMPEYDLKVWKVSASRAQALYDIPHNTGLELPGCTLVIKYPDEANVMQRAGHATITATNQPTIAPTAKYPALADKINAEAAKFDWEGISKAFPEFEGMSTAQAKKIMDNSFEQWDSYQKELEVNKDAKYLEYVVEPVKTAPSTVTPALGAVPVPNIPNVGQAVNVQMPGQGVQPTVQQAVPQQAVPQQAAPQQAAPQQAAPQQSNPFANMAPTLNL